MIICLYVYMFIFVVFHSSHSGANQKYTVVVVFFSSLQQDESLMILNK